MNGEKEARSCAPELDEETEDKIEHFFALEAMEDDSNDTEEQRQAAHVLGRAAIARPAELIAELRRGTPASYPRTPQ